MCVCVCMLYLHQGLYLIMKYSHCMYSTSRFLNNDCVSMVMDYKNVYEHVCTCTCVCICATLCIHVCTYTRSMKRASCDVREQLEGLLERVEI